MNYQEAIKEAEIQIDMYESMILYNKDFEPKNDNSNYERKMDFLKTVISSMQELQEQREIINKNKDYSEVQKWMQNIIDDAMVCLDEMKQDAKKNLNTHYSPLLYEGRKRKAKTVIYALIELNAYKQLGTLEEVREAVEKQEEERPQKVLGIFGGEEYECRECGNTVEYMDEYCKWCGQKMNWE